MDIHDIKKIIQQGESANVEFKTSTAKLKNACETLCAFLNAQGGTVLIGVKDNGDIVGQEITDKTRLEISNFISKIEPPVSVDVDYISMSNGKFVIIMVVEPNFSSGPYVFCGKPYWRVETSTKPMPQQKYHQLLIEKSNHFISWDSEVRVDIKFEHLDGDEILKTLNESIERGRTEAKLATNDPVKALLRLKLMKNGLLTNAAGILFCLDAEEHYPQCLFRLARFKGLTKSTILDSKRIYGNAFAQIEEAEQFIMRHMSISSEFAPGKLARVDNPEYPLRAVREAIVNAISHRDYTIKGGSISVMMYDDRLEITSHGTLPNGITVEELKETHESFPRNEKITHVLYKRGLIESVGTGTQEMVEESRKIGAPDPEYIERGTTFAVRFYSNPKIQTPSVFGEVVVPRHQEILKVMASLDECTTTQILQKMSSPPTDRTLRSDLSKLEKLGYVLRRGEGRGTLWKLVCTTVS